MRAASPAPAPRTACAAARAPGRSRPPPGSPRSARTRPPGCVRRADPPARPHPGSAHRRGRPTEARIRRVRRRRRHRWSAVHPRGVRRHRVPDRRESRTPTAVPLSARPPTPRRAGSLRRSRRTARATRREPRPCCPGRRRRGRAGRRRCPNGGRIPAVRRSRGAGAGRPRGSPVRPTPCPGRRRPRRGCGRPRSGRGRGDRRGPSGRRAARGLVGAEEFGQLVDRGRHAAGHVNS